MLCAPAIIYLIFSLTQIIIDTFKGLYNTALMKFVVMIMVTGLLNFLCSSKLSVVSWVIVFIPFIFMTVTVSMLLYFFGLNASTGTIDYACKNSNYPNDISVDESGNIIIYDPDYNYIANPAYYKAPNIIIPNPQQVTNMKTKAKTTVAASSNPPIFPYWRSTGAYQS